MKYLYSIIFLLMSVVAQAETIDGVKSILGTWKVNYASVKLDKDKFDEGGRKLYTFKNNGKVYIHPLKKDASYKLKNGIIEVTDGTFSNKFKIVRKSENKMVIESWG